MPKAVVLIGEILYRRIRFGDCRTAEPAVEGTESTAPAPPEYRYLNPDYVKQLGHETENVREME